MMHQDLHMCREQKLKKKRSRDLREKKKDKENQSIKRISSIPRQNLLSSKLLQIETLDLMYHTRIRNSKMTFRKHYTCLQGWMSHKLQTMSLLRSSNLSRLLQVPYHQIFIVETKADLKRRNKTVLLMETPLTEMILKMLTFPKLQSQKFKILLFVCLQIRKREKKKKISEIQEQSYIRNFRNEVVKQ